MLMSFKSSLYYLDKNHSSTRSFANIFCKSVIFSSVQSLSYVQLFATPWTAARQTSLSITNSRSLLKLMSIELVMPSNHLILCHPLLLPWIFPSIRVSSSESVLRIRWPKDWSFSFIRHYLQYPKLGGNPSAHQQTFGLKICGPCTQQNITQP